jgi:protein KRI1
MTFLFKSNIALRAKREKLRKERAKQWESESSNPILGHYWDDEVKLDDGEKFLREYILNMGWKTKDSINGTPKTATGGETDEPSVDSDSDDEEFLDKVDEFESKYNFRFEEEGGHAIASHARRVDDSVRVKESKRKRERDLKKSRQEEEKKQKVMELQRLKNLKRQEIKNRLLEIGKVTGNMEIPIEGGLGEECLDTEFDPEHHDKQMEQLLGKDYYEQNDEEFHDGAWAENEGADQTWAENEGADQTWEEETPWYFCDSCIRPIRPGNMRYECRDCEEDDVTICHNCKQSGQHPTSHKLKKVLVGENEQPPEDWQSVLFQLKKKRTRDIAKGKMDELYGMDYEDLIGGDIPCRFKYTQVDSDSFGLSTEAILLKNEKELNQTVSLRKLHPYRKAHPMKRVRYHDGHRRNDVE